MEKLAHAQRQEAAQQRREDKAKAAKERMLAETDPDKQRKMEVHTSNTKHSCCYTSCSL